MINIDDILRIDNFDGLPYIKLLEIINALKTDLKHEKYLKKNEYEELFHKLNMIQTQLNAKTIETDKYKKTINNYHNILKRNLTFKERLFGKINIDQTKKDI